MNEDDYYALREKNISERNAVFSDFLKNLKEETKNIEEKQFPKYNSENTPPRKRRRTISKGSTSYKGSTSSKVQICRKYNTRSKKNIQYDYSDKEDENNDLLEFPKNNRPKLQVLFPWAKPFQRTIDLMRMDICDVDQEEEKEIYNDYNCFKDTNKKRNNRISKSEYDPDNIPLVDEITKDMLNNIAEKSSGKIYCKINGTSCHQCRQKTIDTKTICRSGECIGIRGQFCGPCLRGRYGEDAAEALKDPDWACPPCRGLCNCSICRNKSGLPATGILAPLAQGQGYSSVMDYLQIAEIDNA